MLPCLSAKERSGKVVKLRADAQRSIDGIVAMLAGRVALKEEDAAGTMGRGSIGSALDPASPDIMRHDQSKGTHREEYGSVDASH